jgi:hypothetical protein
MFPGCPDEAGKPIRQRDGRLVVSPLALTVECPTTQAVDGLSRPLGTMGRERCRSGAMHEERSQVCIPLFGYFAQPAFLCARALIGSQTEPRSEVAAGRKALYVADDGAQRCTRQRADTGDLPQLLDTHRCE